MDEDDKVVEISEPASVIDDRDPDLDYTQDLRKKVIDRLLEDNMGRVPTDKEGAQILSMYLDGIDRQSVAKQRIQIAKKDSKSNAQVAKLLEEMSRRRNSGEHIEIDVTPSAEALSRSEAMSGNFLPAPEVVSGELIVDHQQETPEEFFARVEAAHPDLLTGGANDDEDDY
jgi:hypothetical protein